MSWCGEWFFIGTWTFLIVCNGTVGLFKICFSRPPLTTCQWEKGYIISLLSSQGRSTGPPAGLCWYPDGERVLITVLWEFRHPSRFPLIQQGLQGTGMPHDCYPCVLAQLGWSSGLHTWPSVTLPWWSGIDALLWHSEGGNLLCLPCCC